MIKFSPEFTEWFPAVMGLVAAAFGWGMAMYTKHTAHPRKRDTPAE